MSFFYISRAFRKIEDAALQIAKFEGEFKNVKYHRRKETSQQRYCKRTNSDDIISRETRIIIKKATEGSYEQ
jgi:hypothetical protein